MIAFPLEITRDNLPVRAGIGFAFGAGCPESATEDFTFLHPNEEKAWSTMKYQRRRRTYLLGRKAAKAALGVCFPQVAAHRIEIANGVFGQPWLKASAGVDAEFSLSHTEQAAVAVACEAGHPIGVDLERLDADRSAVARSYLAPEEMARMRQLGLPEITALLMLWSAREALAKVLRCGLTVPLAVLAAEPTSAAGGSYTSHFRNFAQYRAVSWALDEFVLSIVLPRSSHLRFSAVDLVRTRFVEAAREPAATKVPESPGPEIP